MGLETTTYIDGLVATNPVHATDDVSVGDDHIRLIKSALLATFPAITGAISATHTEINLLDGATGVTGTGNTVRSASPTFTGNPVFAAASIADAALSANVPLLNAANVFTATQEISGTTPILELNETDSRSWFVYASAGVLNIAIAGGEDAIQIMSDAGLAATLLAFNADALDFNGAADFSSNVTAVTYNALQSSSGGFGWSDDSNTFIWSAAADNINLVAGGASVATFSQVEIDLTADALDFNGAVSPDTSRADGVGYLVTPQNAQAGDYTLVIGDMGKTIYKASGGAGETITIPANGSVAFPVGTVIRIVNNGGGALSVAITTDTLSLAGAGTTGTRTLSDHGVAVIEKVASTEWFISGVGVS